MQQQLKSGAKVIYTSWVLLSASVIAMVVTIIVVAFVGEGTYNQRVFFEQLASIPLVLIPYLGGIIFTILAMALPALAKLDGAKIGAVGGFLAIVYFFVIPSLG